MYLKVIRALIGACAMTACLAVSATPALAAGKPIVEAKAATAIEYSAAVLHGTVNPNGAEDATEYRFEYGTASVEEHSTTYTSIGTGTTAVPVSATLSALAVHTKYEFRLKAKNEYGVVTSSTLTFTTKGSSSPPEFSPATKHPFTSIAHEFKLHVYGPVVTCKNETTDGEVTGKYTAGGIVMTLTGCTAPSEEGGKECEVSSTGHAGGEIVTVPLKGQLGSVPTKEDPSGTGLMLEPEKGAQWWKIGGACFVEQELGGELAFGVGTLMDKSKTNTFTAALYEGSDIREIKLSSGETVKLKLHAMGAGANLTGLDEVSFPEATEIT